MKKSVLIVVVLALLALIFIFYSMKDRMPGSPEAHGACSSVCAHIQNTCGGIIDEISCANNCQVWTDEMIEAIYEYDDCQFLVTQLGIALKEDQGNMVNVEDCAVACENFVTLCVVTNSEANNEMIEAGMQSCMSSCGAFDQEFVDCLISAQSCEEMTQVCGL